MTFYSCLVFSLVTLSTVFGSCGKGDSPSPAGPPTNLTLSFVVSTDNSGNVNFTATATNAVSYEYDLGNGVFRTVANGLLTYKYPASGTYSVNVVAKSANGQTASARASVTVSVGRSLIWADEFDAPGAPDPAKWGYDLGAGGWGNNELQYYTNRLDNAIISNGTLKIIAKRESFSGSPFTSARLLSRGKFSFQYGRVDVRAKLPVGVGTWPAAWMLGNNFGTVGWPACGEIDIMEHKGSELNKIYGTVHYPGNSGGNAIGGTRVASNVTTEFRMYSVEWNAQFIKFLIDDVEFFSFANNNTLPFNQPFFLLLNVAMGGTFGGSVDPAFTSGTMEVDYVRVYN
jgi:beta-glucanase (GH16 family)